MIPGRLISGVVGNGHGQDGVVVTSEGSTVGVAIGEFDAGAADDPMLVFNVTDQVRETIQQTLYSLLMKRESVFR